MQGLSASLEETSLGLNEFNGLEKLDKRIISLGYWYRFILCCWFSITGYGVAIAVPLKLKQPRAVSGFAINIWPNLCLIYADDNASVCDKRSEVTRRGNRQAQFCQSCGYWCNESASDHRSEVTRHAHEQNADVNVVGVHMNFAISAYHC